VSTIRMTGALDPRSGWDAEGCTIAKSLDLLSTKSAFLLLREAFYGATRFDDLSARAGISEPVAAARLKELVERGLLERHEYREPGQRARPGYALTRKGAELLPVLVGLMQWGDRWATDDGGPVELRHRDCGSRVHVELRCGNDHEVALDEVDLAARRARRPTTRRGRATGSR
jgi:DNA-binding HxlR family transcriptional regulator